MPHCWKSHAEAHWYTIIIIVCTCLIFRHQHSQCHSHVVVLWNYDLHRWCYLHISEQMYIGIDWSIYMIIQCSLHWDGSIVLSTHNIFWSRNNKMNFWVITHSYLRGLVKNNWALPHNILVWYCRQQMWLFSISIICRRCFDPEEISFGSFYYGC